MIFAILVFLVVLAVFAVDLVHRTPAALAGGILLVMAALSARRRPSRPSTGRPWGFWLG
jgi:hypothetical protein